jgi:hypothetical protein
MDDPSQGLDRARVGRAGAGDGGGAAIAVAAAQSEVAALGRIGQRSTRGHTRGARP